MNKMKKGLISVLSLSVLSLSASAVISASADMNPVGAGQPEQTSIQVNVDKELQADFKSITGVIKEINDYGKEGNKLVTVQSGENKDFITNFVVSEDTYLVNEAKLTVGTTIVAFYDASKPVIMIYPAQLAAEVIAVVNDKETVKLDRFDKKLVSSDNTLALHIGDNTKIQLQDGTPFDGELGGRKLVVTYGISTRSIPAQTTPDKIVVLYEKAVPLDESTEVDPSIVIGDVASKKIVVNDKVIQAPAAYLDEHGKVMVPVRAIAEALDYKITWEAANKKISLNGIISAQIGKDYYVFARMAPIELGTAPTLVDGNMFVPLSFFKDVAQLHNAYVLEDSIVIDNTEKME